MLSILVRGIPETQEALERFPTRLAPRLFKVGQDGLAYASTLARTTYLSGPTETFLEPRRGTLRASWTRGHPLNLYRLTQQGLVIEGEIGTTIPWAASHENDITITPKRSRWLRIPLAYAKTGRGVLKFQYQVASARDIPNTRIFRSRRGFLIIWQILTSRRGRAKAQLVPLFVLKRSVFRKARPVKVPVEQATQPWLEQRTAATLVDAEARTNVELKREGR